MQIDSAIEEMHRGSFGLSEYPRGKQKIILKEEQERDFGEWCVKWR